MSAVLRLGFDRNSARTVDADGRLHVALTNLSKAAVNPYYGREIPGAEALGLDPAKIYRLYRDPTELEKGAATFNNLPLLVTHVGVNADNPRPEMVCGSIGSDVRFEAPYLVGSLCVWTSEAIARVESEATRELSCAYRYDPVMVPGVTPRGESYDGVMTNIRGNHVALVEEGRAGPDVLVADSSPRSFKMRRSTLATALLAILPTGFDRLALDKAMDDAEEREEAEDALSDEEKKSAADAAFEEKKSKDAACDALTDEEKEMAYNKAKDKKASDRRAKDEAEKKAADKRARDADPSTGRKPESGAPNPAKDKAMDAASVAAAIALASDSARKSAVADVTALFQARKVVAPLVGDVAFDSATEVYAFALKRAGVDTKGVHESAYPALVKMALDAHTAKAARPAGGGEGPRVAYDSASATLIGKALPGLRSIRAA